MATYFLSQSPTISNFGQDTNAVDNFFIDTVPSGSLRIAGQGPNLVVSDGVHTATFLNLSFEQFGQGPAPGGPFISNTFDGSLVIVGDGSFSAANDAAANNINGGSKDDYFVGLGGNDVINTGGGADFIFGNQGNDQITLAADPAGANLSVAAIVFGGQNDDQILGDSATRSMVLFGNLGDDVISIGGNGSNQASSIYGGQGNDAINAIGSTANNLLSGDIGNDQVIGGNGNDTLFGGDGADMLNGGAGSNVLFGNQGDDVLTMNGSAGTADTAFGGQGRDIVNGAGFRDLMFGNLGADTLNGGAGSDTLFGGQDNDVLNGGAGADLLSGDLGNDLYDIVIANNGGGETGITDATADTVAGFQSGADRLVLGISGTTTNYTEITNGNVTTVAGAITAAQNSGVRTYTFVAGQANGYLVIDRNTDAAVDGVIVLAGLNTLDGFDLADILAVNPPA